LLSLDEMFLIFTTFRTNPVDRQILEKRSRHDIGILIANLSYILIPASSAYMRSVERRRLRDTRPFHLYHRRCRFLFTGSAKCFDEKRYYLVHITYDTIVAVLENRRVLILIDRDYSRCFL